MLAPGAKRVGPNNFAARYVNVVLAPGAKRVGPNNFAARQARAEAAAKRE